MWSCGLPSVRRRTAGKTTRSRWGRKVRHRADPGGDPLGATRVGPGETQQPDLGEEQPEAVLPLPAGDERVRCPVSRRIRCPASQGAGAGERVVCGTAVGFHHQFGRPLRRITGGGRGHPVDTVVTPPEGPPGRQILRPPVCASGGRRRDGRGRARAAGRTRMRGRRTRRAGRGAGPAAGYADSRSACLHSHRSSRRAPSLVSSLWTTLPPTTVILRFSSRFSGEHEGNQQDHGGEGGIRGFGGLLPPG
ncbi:hypothetical protein EV190_104237 [Actinorugispora endophytica]|uniref:Uncharacterized protein n=1 Tax=Actinorugispora endophytica TaxID=1605990 RepID=A0A4R6V567_9ACTN|nr:hypothetical protein EV190_104237 [Actinorugispora endophytica]